MSRADSLSSMQKFGRIVPAGQQKAMMASQPDEDGSTAKVNPFARVAKVLFRATNGKNVSKTAVALTKPRRSK